MPQTITNWKENYFQASNVSHFSVFLLTTISRILMIVSLTIFCSCLKSCFEGPFKDKFISQIFYSFWYGESSIFLCLILLSVLFFSCPLSIQIDTCCGWFGWYKISVEHFTPFYIAQWGKIWILSSALFPAFQACKGPRILQRKTSWRFEVIHSLLRKKTPELFTGCTGSTMTQQDSLRHWVYFSRWPFTWKWSSCYRVHTPATIGSNIMEIHWNVKGIKRSRTSLVRAASVGFANNFYLVY